MSRKLYPDTDYYKLAGKLKKRKKNRAADKRAKQSRKVNRPK